MPLFEEQGYYARLKTPAGPLLCAVDEAGRLIALHFVAEGEEDRFVTGVERLGYRLKRSAPRCAEVERQLTEYFRRERRDFDLELALHGTEFQQALWRAMLKIPYGTTLSYSELAQASGYPQAVRAVGGACAANRIAVVVPCHRVVGASGALTGYMGGLPVKRELLALEQGQAALFDVGGRGKRKSRP